VDAHGSYREAASRADLARWLWVLGRLKEPDTSVNQATAEMTAIAQRESEAYPDSYKGVAASRDAGARICDH